MARTSSDEAFLERVARARAKAKPQAGVIGATAAVLHGAPLTTQDVDLLVRRTPVAVLPILEDTLRVRRALDESAKPQPIEKRSSRTRRTSKKER